MKKTIEQWLNELPVGYRELALGNMFEKHKNNNHLLMAEAILEAFTWGKTKEGLQFWDMVFEHYVNGTPLPPLPKNTNGE